MSDNEAIRSGRKPKSKIEDIPQLDIDTLNVVGTSYSGPAFVPQQVSRHNQNEDVYNTFVNIFGNNINNKYKNLKDEYNSRIDSQGYEASRNWFSNGGEQLSFTRVLGIGNGKLNSESVYEKSGFNVTNPIYSGSVLSGNEYINPKAKAGGIKGSVSFVLKEYTNNTVDALDNLIDPFRKYLTEELGITASAPKFITDIIMCPSGVLPSLHYSEALKQVEDEHTKDPTDDSSNITSIRNKLKNQQSLLDFSTDNNNSIFGSPISKINNREYYLYLNGLDSDRTGIVRFQSYNEYYNQNNESYNSKFNKNYFSKKILDKGHYYYSTFQSNKTLKNSTSDTNIGIFTCLEKSIVDGLASGLNLPDYNDFSGKYTTAVTPWITSQPVNRIGIENNRQDIHKRVKRLFKFYALTDGESGNKYRIKVCPKKIFHKLENKYSLFDVYVFEYNVINNEFEILESYEDLNLDPHHINYIERRIGSQYSYYNIERDKVYTEGRFESISKHIRVEVDNDVFEKSIERNLIPSGFESYPKINFKKEVFNKYKDVGIESLNSQDKFDSYFESVNQMPITYIPNHTRDLSIDTKLVEYKNYWGPLFFNIIKDRKESRNRKFLNNSIDSFEAVILNQQRYSYLSDSRNSKSFSPHYFYTKYFQKYKNKTINNEDVSNDINFLIEDNNWLNSFFHLEKIIYPVLDSETISWEDSIYMRSGKVLKNNNFHSTLHNHYKYVNIDNLLNHVLNPNQKVDYKNLSFDVFTYGGFDGTNILDKDKHFLNNSALSREENRETFSTTKFSYERGIEVSSKYENCLNDIFIVPGISSSDLITKILNISNEETRFIFIGDARGGAISSEISGDFLRVENNVNRGRNTTIDKNEVNRKIQYREDEISNFNTNYKKFIGSNYSSRYFVPVIGEMYNEARKTIICPSIYASGLMARTISEGIESEKFQYALATELVDNENLRVTDSEFKKNSDTFKESSLNIMTIHNNKISLYTSNTTFSIRDSVYRNSSSVRAINFVKKRIEYELLLNENSILFQLNSSVNDIYKFTENKLRAVMENLISEQVISSYVVSVPKLNVRGINRDLINNLLNIKVYIKLINAADQSDRTETITLSELNKEIKSLTSLSENIQLIRI